MPLNKIKREYEERRVNLIQTLQKKNKKLDLSKQHQLYGAIKEIENFLKSIESARTEVIAGVDFELKREGPKPVSERMGVAVKQMGGKTKGAFDSVIIFFSDRVIGGTGRAIKKTSRKIGMIGEVAREVRKRNDDKLKEL